MRDLLRDLAAQVGRTEAELIVAAVCGVGRADLLTALPPTPEQSAEATEVARRRGSGEPLQYLLGTACAGALDLAVGPGVFVPRPETELLLEWAGRAITGVVNPCVLDVCTGSGYLALELAHRRPDATVHAVEREEAALEWSRRNAAERAAAGDTPVRIHAGDARDPELLDGFDGRVDLVVSNPPYIPDHGDREAAARELPDDVGGHEPLTALFGGSDGLDVIRPLVARAAEWLKPGGHLGIEHDDTTGAAVAALMEDSGCFGNVVRHTDLAGRDRFVTGVRLGSDKEQR